MKKILLLLFPLGLFAQVSTWSETTSKLKYANTIVVEDLQRHITILAGDSLQGRETGKAGQKMAANYIANFFKKILKGKILIDQNITVKGIAKVYKEFI